MNTKVDGRRARGLRTRDGIVQALIDLADAGETNPTAQRIAEQAGVSVRSVYQHYSDVEHLFEQAAARLYEWASSVCAEIDPALPRQDRIARLTEERALVFERVTPFTRTAPATPHAADPVHRLRLNLMKDDRRRVERTFQVELESLEGERRAEAVRAMDVLASWSAWDHLRQSGDGVTEARRAMARALEWLLDAIAPVGGNIPAIGLGAEGAGRAAAKTASRTRQRRS